MIPPKWKHIQGDQFDWVHPTTKVRVKGTLLVDENCRVRIGKILYDMVGDKARKNVRWPELKEFYEEAWLPYFGPPQRFRVDPEGAWMSAEAAEYFGAKSILLDPIPGQAHWQISIAEEAIQSTKSTMTALALEFPEISAKEALARATAAGNGREDVRGYSPQQHALGRAPDLDGRFYDPDFDNLNTVEAEKVTRRSERA